jgi:hypothetical protein
VYGIILINSHVFWISTIVLHCGAPGKVALVELWKIYKFALTAMFFNRVQELKASGLKWRRGSLVQLFHHSRPVSLKNLKKGKSVQLDYHLNGSSFEIRNITYTKQDCSRCVPRRSIQFYEDFFIKIFKGFYCTPAKFNIQQLYTYILPVQCIYVFCMDLRTNSDYLCIQY